jgi:hypothetical protein
MLGEQLGVGPEISLGVAVHGPELVDGEVSATTADSLLGEQNRTA